MYRQYGMNASIQDAFIAETVEKKLKEREFVEQMGDRVVYRKVYDAIKEIITLKEKIGGSQAISLVFIKPGTLVKSKIPC